MTLSISALLPRDHVWGCCLRSLRQRGLTGACRLPGKDEGKVADRPKTCPSTLVVSTWGCPASEGACRQAPPYRRAVWTRVSGCKGRVQEKRGVGSGDPGGVYAEVARQTGRAAVAVANTGRLGPIPRCQLRTARQRRAGSRELP